MGVLSSALQYHNINVNEICGIFTELTNYSTLMY